MGIPGHIDGFFNASKILSEIIKFIGMVLWYEIP